MKKKLISGIVAGLVLALGISAGGSVYNPVYADGYAAIEDLNLRSDMSLSQSPFDIIPEGTVVNILSVSDDGGWAEVSYNGHTGYILTMYLEYTEDDTAVSSSGNTDAEQTVSSHSVSVSGYVATEDLNLRSDMDISSEPFDVIPEGQFVHILSVSDDGGWAEVSYNGRTGYILTMYLTYSDSQSVESGTYEGADDTVSTESSHSEALPRTARTGTPLIVVDAGHGGDDPGAVAYHNGVEMHESDYALSLSRFLQSDLEGYGYNVLMTRTGDENISLNERVSLANSSGADLFFSVHHNAAPSSVDGGLILYPSEKTNGNYEDIPASKALAESLAYSYNSVGIDNDGARADADVSGYSLNVLRNTGMMSIMAEVGFLTNPGDAAVIADIYSQKVLAESFAGMINLYYSDRSSQ